MDTLKCMYSVGIVPCMDNSKVGVKRKYETTRVAAEKPPARPLKVTAIESIVDGSCFPVSRRAADDAPRTCCQKGCNLAFAAHEDSIPRARARVPPPGTGQQAARKMFVRSCLQDNGTLTLRDNAGLSLPVCTLFFVHVTGCSKKLISSAKALGGAGMKRRHLPNTSAQIVTAFILDLANRWEFQPDSDCIHMAYPSKVFVYEQFCNSDGCKKLGDPCAYSYFVLMWNKHCPHVKLEKTMRFTKCDVCILATEALDCARVAGGASWKDAAHATLEKSLQDHYEDVSRSRRVYMRAKITSLQNPDELLCIAIDGSDQSSYTIPYFKQETKDTAKGWKMRLKLIGALVNGRLCHFFTIGSNWESGSNLTIQVLHSTLEELAKTAEANGTSLPRKLHLQRDNCSRGNKNKFFFGYLHLLVSLGIFDVIEMHFGLKGHTHDEIDQVFSRVGVALRQTDAYTRPLLGNHIVNGYKRQVADFPVAITHLYNCANIRDLLQDKLFPIPSITKPQAFRVSKDPADGRVKLQMQARGYENKWGAIGRDGKYSQGYVEIMRPGPLPDLRQIPPCPRKKVNDNTLAMHRNCIEASRPRIQVGLRNGNEGIAYDDAVLELYGEVDSIGEHSPKECDWKLDMYNLPPVGEEIGGEDTPDGAAGGEGWGGDQLGEEGGGNGGESSGDGAGAAGSDPPDGGEENPPEDDMKWEIGWFVAFPLPATNPCPLLVGKILEVVRADEGDEVKVHWYTPKRRKMPRRRSLYGKGGWSPEFKLKRGTRVRIPDKGRESAHSACATFPSLLSGNDALPHFVWDAVAESAPPPPDEEEEEEEEGGLEEEEEEVEPEEEDDDEEEDGGDSQPEAGGWKEPVQQQPSLRIPARVRAPVRLTAAAFRTRRGAACDGGGGSAGRDA